MITIFNQWLSKTKKTIDNSQNPWAGLASYEDPETAKRKLKFCGRDDDSYDVARLIMGNIFVTLYGKSGIGKTSLLNAGVFPVLREEEYIPLILRLGIRDEVCPKSYQTIIIEAIEKKVRSLKTIKVIDEQKDLQAVDYLWNYFARHRFYNKDNEPVSPVIVLDQFEEVFRKDRKEAEKLLRQLDYLNDIDHTLDNCTVDGEAYRYEQNYRFVVSIREDDFYRLEDSIDNCYLPALKRCRYRLRSLSEQGAKEVILTPGKDIFVPDEKEKIAKKIINIAIEDGETINSNILSLLCSRIYLAKLQDNNYGRIGYKFVEQLVSTNPLEQFYLEATDPLNSKEKKYLENNLVDETGRRGYIPKESFDKMICNGERLLEGPTKILQLCNGRVELIHDSFCPIICELKLQRKEHWLSLIEHVSLFVISILIAIFIIYTPVSINLIGDLTLRKVYNPRWDFSIIFQIGVMIYLFIALGIIRKLYQPKLIIWGFSISSIPILLYTLLYICEYLNDKTTEYILPAPFVLSSVILTATSIFAFFYSRKSISSSTIKTFTWTYRGRIWLTILLCFYLYVALFGSTVYQATEDFASVSIIWVALITSFCTTRKDNNDNWFWFFIPIFMLPVSFMICFTSDTSLFSLTIDNFSSILPIIPYVMIPIAIPTTLIYISKREERKEMIITMLVMALLYFGGSLIFYIMLYKYKFWMLFIYIFLWLLFLWSFLDANNSKHPIRICVEIFVFIMISYSFYIGYNPLLRNINSNIQYGNWRWKSIIMKSNGEYEIANAWTGKKLLNVAFNNFKDGHLFVKTNYLFKTSVHNTILNPINNTSMISYCYIPEYEYCLYTGEKKKILWALSICYYRDEILSKIIAGEKISPEQCNVYLNQLINEEIANVTNLLRQESEETIYNNLSEKLCKLLSASILKSMTTDSNNANSENMVQWINAFDAFISVYMYKTIPKSDNMEWDNLFNNITQRYMFEKKDETQESVVSSILPILIQAYQSAQSFKVKTDIYGKIYKLNQINKENNNIDLINTIKNPYE